MVLLWVSSAIMLTPCLVSWRQLCCIGNPEEARYKRTVFVTIWISLALPLNLMLYAANLYDSGLFYWTYLLEAFLLVFGMHIFRVLAFSFVESMFVNHGQITRPKWVTVTTYLVETLVIVAALSCYSLGLFSSSEVEMEYIHIFYVLLCGTMFVLGIIIYIVVRPISVILKQIRIDGRSGMNEEQIMSSILAMKVMHSMIVVVCITSAVHIVLDVDYAFQFLDVHDRDLVECVIHSQTLIVLAFSAVLMIVEKKGSCCFVGKFSLWRSCCIGGQYVHVQRSMSNKENEAGSALLAQSASPITDAHL